MKLHYILRLLYPFFEGLDKSQKRAFGGLMPARLKPIDTIGYACYLQMEFRRDTENVPCFLCQISGLSV